AAREGARVALAARSMKTVAETADAIRARGGSAIALQCDLSVDEQIRAAVDATVAEFGPIDAVFYNAAFYDNDQDDLVIDDGAWGLPMNVNLRGPMSVARYTLPSMIERRAGSFVFTSSDAAFYAEDVRIGYGVSKAGMNAFTRFLASRYGRQGIRANAV